MFAIIKELMHRISALWSNRHSGQRPPLVTRSSMLKALIDVFHPWLTKVNDDACVLFTSKTINGLLMACSPGQLDLSINSLQKFKTRV